MPDKPNNFKLPSNTSHTQQPHWSNSSHTGALVSQASHRKFYIILSVLVILMGGIAVAATMNNDKQIQPKGSSTKQNLMLQPDSTVDSLLYPQMQLHLLKEPDNSMPRNFRNTRNNEISNPKWLAPVRNILIRYERPLRIVQIGDSHVAGGNFPMSLKQSLTECLGNAESHLSGSGIWFKYIARNGATIEHFSTYAYMQRIKSHDPDLIIVSLGTNDAHGMGYRESIHKQQLDKFFDMLKEHCPHSTVLLTTPPGDYLRRKHTYYRKSSRTGRRVRRSRYTRSINPMSARCAKLLANYGEEHKMPVWNLFEICGGKEAAQRNWVSAHYMRPDRIHFMPHGYQLHGKLLGEALVRALARE